MEFSLLIDGVGRAWRAEDLHDKQHSLTGQKHQRNTIERLLFFLRFARFRRELLSVSFPMVDKLHDVCRRAPGWSGMAPHLLSLFVNTMDVRLLVDKLHAVSYRFLPPSISCMISPSLLVF